MQGHSSSISAIEILPAFLKDLKDYKGYVITKLALKLLVLTFVRPGELRGAQWKEINFKRMAGEISPARLFQRRSWLYDWP